jgi:hypothetical protein
MIFHGFCWFGGLVWGKWLHSSDIQKTQVAPELSLDIFERDEPITGKLNLFLRIAYRYTISGRNENGD